MRNLLSVSVLLVAIMLNVAVSAQHQHDRSGGRPTGPVDLGEISFPTSGPAEAQKHFIEGVLLLHSFEYGRARRSFQAASQLAPDFAMAYWGEAMTYDHRIWGEQDQRAGLAALARLAPTPADRRAKAPTLREKMYLDAVEALFGDSDDPEVIAAAYSKAMEALTKQFPDDVEARAFYSLSLLGLTGTTRNTANYMRAAAVAEEIYEKNPRHPGALHYLIHAYDDPVHAPLGLRAARIYGSVARGASHAQHMPSHIYFALGMWEDSIKSNTDSMNTARDAGQGGYHPLHWLQHAYLQIGRVADAAKLVSIVEEDIKMTPSAYARTHLAMTRATFLVEAGPDATATMMQPVDSSGVASQVVFANHDLAIGLEHIRRNDLRSAGQKLNAIKQKAESMRQARTSAIAASRYSQVSQADIDTISVIEKMLAAAIEFASGERESGARNMATAAEAEDRLVFEYGPPAIVKPAWEAAGEMFFALDRKEDAANAFRNALKRYPNRRLSNEGLMASSSK
jgi:tetratricopeptide (TPR) repeat protein